MIKILLRTTYFIKDGASVHTVVVEVKNQEEADVMIKRVNDQYDNKYLLNTHAMLLG